MLEVRRPEGTAAYQAVSDEWDVKTLSGEGIEGSRRVTAFQNLLQTKWYTVAFLDLAWHGTSNFGLGEPHEQVPGRWPKYPVLVPDATIDESPIEITEHATGTLIQLATDLSIFSGTGLGSAPLDKLLFGNPRREHFALGPTWVKQDQGIVDAVENRLTHLASLRDDWNSYGARPITEEAIRQARELLKAMADSTPGDVPIPFIAPLPSGGLQIEWSGPSGSELIVEVPTAGEPLSYLLVEALPSGKEVATEAELRSGGQLRELIHRLQNAR